MSTDELSGTTAPTDDHPATVRTPPLRRPWVVPLGLLTVIFIGYAVPPYLSLDPALARIQPMPPHAAYYPLLVTHIFLGSVALLTACLQVALAPPVSPEHSPLERTYLCRCGAAGIRVRHDHLANRSAWRQSAGREHHAGCALVWDNGGRLPCDPTAPLR
ncbi:MAG TPA: hypothetical protein VI074_05315 [Propionibacteriaceae bacterium]